MIIREGRSVDMGVITPLPRFITNKKKIFKLALLICFITYCFFICILSQGVFPVYAQDLPEPPGGIPPIYVEEVQSEILHEIVISFVGDVNPQMLKGLNDEKIEKIKSYFEGSHLVFGNLECPVTDHTQRTPGKSQSALESQRDFVLRAESSTGDYLQKLGFGVMSLANNHIMDYNAQGLEDTVSMLDSMNIAFCGAGKNENQAIKPVIIEVEGVRMAFLAFSEIKPLYSKATDRVPGIACISYPPSDSDLKIISSQIKKARDEGAEIVK